VKAQSKSPGRCREKSSPSSRLQPQASIRQQHSASVQLTPVARPQIHFTIEEHLRVQMEIEARAHRFWFAKDCALKSALDDWLKAENEVLAEFAKTLTQRQQVQPVSGETQTKIGKAPTLLLAVPYQSTTKLNPKLATTFQHSL
jgi:hypothetical protein